MNSDKDNLKQYLKDYADFYLEHSKNGLYVCPICSSGKGRNKTGAFSIKGERWNCFSCNHSGDLFDLIGAIEDLKTYPERLKRAEELYGTGTQPPKKKTPPQQEQEVDYSAFIDACNKNLDKTDYYRGISLETLNRFKIGYFEGGRLPGYDRPTTARLIIPTSKHSFVARDTTGNSQTKVLKSKGRMRLFNGEALAKAERPIFITEGEIDALSIIELGFEAIGLGGTSGVNRLLKALERTRPQQPLILALDNDTAGETATQKLKDGLNERNIEYLIAVGKEEVGGKTETHNIYKEYKDANEAMQHNRSQFKIDLEQYEKKGLDRAAEDEEERQENLAAEREEYKRKNNAIEHLLQFLNEMEIDTPCTPTGFESLDYALGGGLYEGFYVIGAISSLGKTTFTLQMADNIAKSGQDVLIFSLEMARTELMAKSISRLTLETALEIGGRASDAKTARTITTKARRKYFTQADKNLVALAINKYAESASNLYIYEGTGKIGTQQIREIVAKHNSTMGRPPVVIVDYLQLLAPKSDTYGDKKNIDNAVTELKIISRDFKTPVIAISSFNRGGYNTPVSMESFKESGGIEYSSDVLIGLQLKGVGESSFDANEAKQKNPREIELVILKNRHGETGKKIEFWYNAPFNYFNERNIEPQEDRRRY